MFPECLRELNGNFPPFWNTSSYPKKASCDRFYTDVSSQRYTVSSESKGETSAHLFHSAGALKPKSELCQPQISACGEVRSGFGSDAFINQTSPGHATLIFGNGWILAFSFYMIACWVADGVAIHSQDLWVCSVGSVPTSVTVCMGVWMVVWLGCSLPSAQNC